MKKKKMMMMMMMKRRKKMMMGVCSEVSPVCSVWRLRGVIDVCYILPSLSPSLALPLQSLRGLLSSSVIVSVVSVGFLLGF